MATQHSPGFEKLCEAARSRIQEVAPAAIAAAIAAPKPAFTLIDVREDHEWALGHLPGAIHLGRGIIERDIETRLPDPTTEIVLYCGGGYRSALAAESLGKMGYSRIRSLAGGFRGWQERGLPVETPTTKAKP